MLVDTTKEGHTLILNLLYDTCLITQQNKHVTDALATVWTLK